MVNVVSSPTSRLLAILFLPELVMGGQSDSASAQQVQPSPTGFQNWIGTVSCKPVRIIKPRTINDVIEAVQSGDRVRAFGVGHSYNQFLCSNDTMIDMKGLNQVIGLNAKSKTITAQAGVITRDVVEYAGERGYSLPTYPYYTDQTIGGAVATGSHGSSTRYGGLASFVSALKLVLADGTVRTVSRDDPDQDVWDAARVSVGLLGVIVEVTLDLVPDRLVQRWADIIGQDDVLSTVAGGVKDPASVDETQIFYFTSLKQAVRCRVADVPLEAASESEPLESPNLVLNERYGNPINGTSAREAYVQGYADIAASGDSVAISTLLQVGNYLTCAPGVYKLSSGLPNLDPLALSVLRASLTKYSEYEFVVPVNRAVQCFRGLLDIFNNSWDFSTQLKGPILFRFDKATPGLVNPSSGGARIWVDFHDDDTYKRNAPSPAFAEVRKWMRSDMCGARMHWGKGGLFSSGNPDPLWTTQDAAYTKKKYSKGDAYDHFVSVVKRFDPTGKFADVDGMLVS